MPTSITLEDLREDIRRVRGVVSVHELHVWQLSEAKIIASVHVCVDRGVEYMNIAADIREVLHAYNVHSCTIQPEYDVVDNEGKPIQKTVCFLALFMPYTPIPYVGCLCCRLTTRITAYFPALQGVLVIPIRHVVVSGLSVSHILSTADINLPPAVSHTAALS